MIEAAGHTTQSLGVGRVLGQIFACLYFNPEPMSLDDLTTTLGISKGSASMCVRQLEHWKAVEKVWIKGDRKDYYRAKEALGKILRNAMMDLTGKRIESSALLLDEMQALLNARMQEGGLSTQDAFARRQVEKIRLFQEKAREMWNSVILKMLLK
jgi:DNA-binding transcriptional regulator GbsR (MarR family)